jgi:HD superfamily phosphodiesterase
MLRGWTIRCAESVSQRLLAPLGARWVHPQAVSDTARWLATVDDRLDRDTLIAAAYLHDIGYTSDLLDTGHHGIDGARYLARQGQPRLAALVANHSGAWHEADLRGLAAELNESPSEVSPTADALTYCDLVTGAAGESLTLAERFSDVQRRYGKGDVVTEAMERAYPELEAVVRRVEGRLATVRR